MKLKWVINPSSKKPDPMLTMSVMVVTVACIKFLLEGITFTVKGHNIDFGHVDSMVYAALVTPVLGVHGYIKTRTQSSTDKQSKVDKPDAD